MPLRVRLAIGAVLGLGLPAAPAVAADPELVSRATNGDAGNEQSLLSSDVFGDGTSANAVSRDGNLVAFASLADNLDDDGESWDIFIRDVAAQTTTLVPVDPSPYTVTYQTQPAIAGDGHAVAFVTYAELSPEENGSFTDVYVRDLVSGESTLASVRPDPDSPPWGGAAPSLSSDGTRVAFHEEFLSDPNGRHVYVHDVGTRATTLVSRASGSTGAAAIGGSYDAAISADGTHVAFVSEASNLGGADGPSWDVFVRDLDEETTALVSPYRPGEIESAIRPAISEDGRYVAFEAGPASRIYRTDLETGDTIPVSGDLVAGSPSISDDGNRVAFQGGSQVYVRDIEQGLTTLVSRRRGVVGDDRSSTAVISGDGESVAFQSDADNLSDVDHKGFTDVFRAEIAFEDAGMPQLSIADATVTEGEQAVFEITLSAPSPVPVTVDWTASDGTAEAADYTGGSGSVTLEPGDTAEPLPVQTTADLLDEPDETFTISLGDPVDAVIDDGEAVGTILDDDPAPALSIGDVTVTEGDVDAPFEVTLSAPSARPVTVDVQTADETAEAGLDYGLVERRLVFAPGDTSEPFPVPILDDALDEDDETFTVSLTGVTNASIIDGVAVGRIRDDEGCVELRYGDRATPGRIDAAQQVRCYWFDGGLGDRVRVGLLRTAGTLDPVNRVRRPDGSVQTIPSFCGDTVLDLRECSLDASGRHEIEVRDFASTKTGDYKIAIRRLNQPGDCVELRYGEPANPGQIGEQLETDCFWFDGRLGDRVRVGLIKTAGTLDPVNEVVRDDGTIQTIPSFCDDTVLDVRECTLDRDGRHTILVRDFALAKIGDYKIAIRRLNQPDDCVELRYGEPANPGQIGEQLETDCYQFDGRTGDRVGVTLVRTSGDVDLVNEVVRDDGTIQTIPSFCDDTVLDQRECTLDRDGRHTILVRDFALAKTGDYEIAIRLLSGDVDPPETTIESGPSGPTNDATPTFTFGSDEPRSTFACRFDAGPWTACSSPSTLAILSDDSYTFSVRATDAAGNTDGTPASRTFRVDTDPPETTIDSGPDGTTDDSTPTFAFSSDEPGSTFGCGIGEEAICVSPFTSALLPDGAYTFTTRATDTAGNADPTPAQRGFTVVTRLRAVRCDGRPATIVVPRGGAPVSGTAGPDVILGSDDADTIDGRGGADRICGGGGGDRLGGQNGNDRLLGGRGPDRMNGGDGRDEAAGGAGADRLRGAGANDRLLGGAGDDDIDGGPARDVCRGGAGTNTLRNCER